MSFSTTKLQKSDKRTKLTLYKKLQDISKKKTKKTVHQIKLTIYLQTQNLLILQYLILF